MAAIFTGNSAENIRKFFTNMIVSDVNVPHTKTRLSPITFNEFLIRNQIVTVNPFEIYNEANKIWVEFYRLNEELFKASGRAAFDLDICETKHSGWNLVIDFLNRMLDVEKFEESYYYQMHYMAHVCYLFNLETEKLDQDTMLTYRTIFNDLTGPVLYDCLIQTQYAFLPVINYSDVRFATLVSMMCAKIRMYISNHSGNSMNYKQYNENRCKYFKDETEKLIKDLYSKQYQPDSAWSSEADTYFRKLLVYKADMDMCELHEGFARDGMGAALFLEKAMKIRDKYLKNRYTGEAVELADDLLDIRYLTVPEKKEGQNVGS